MKDIFISPKVLGWHKRWADWDSGFTEGLDRPYQIFSHAEELLDMERNSHFRADCVVSLNKALSRRIEHLNSIYKFRKIPFYSKKDGLFEILEDLGFIRPRMLEELRNIRNAVEHQDAQPPNAGRCRELCDFVWYFLRTTDQFLTGRPELMEYSKFQELDSEYAFNWRIKFESGIKVSVFKGSFPSESLSFEDKPGWVKISNTNVILCRDFKSAELKRSIPGRRFKGLKTDLFIRGGSVVSPQTVINRMIRDYFSIVVKGVVS